MEKGIEAYQLLVEAGLCRTRGEARRLIAQGGVSLQERRIPAFDWLVGLKDFQDRRLLIRVGKKKYHLLKISLILSLTVLIYKCISFFFC